MQCLYCDFESNEIDSDKAEKEITKHTVLCHPARSVNEGLALSIVTLGYQYHVSTSDIIEAFFKARKELGLAYIKYDAEDSPFTS